jgi:hypothetical protein
MGGKVDEIHPCKIAPPARNVQSPGKTPRTFRGPGLSMGIRRAAARKRTMGEEELRR